MIKILIVEDDLALNQALTFDLSKAGYQLKSAYNGKSALEYIKKEVFDLVILDVNLPDILGFSLITTIKKDFSKLPIIFLSGCDLDQDIIKGYDLGADEYITKPFNFVILHKKITAILNRTKETFSNIYLDNHLYFNPSSLETKINGRVISLTPTELKLLEYLIRNKGQILTKENILSYLWDSKNNYVDEHTLTVNVTRLRNKIENTDYKYIKTIYGIGYMWVDYESK